MGVRWVGDEGGAWEVGERDVALLSGRGDGMVVQEHFDDVVGSDADREACHAVSRLSLPLLLLMYKVVNNF